MKPDTVLAELRHALQNLYGNRLHDVVLFGSWARGDANPDSDIDIAVVLMGPVAPGEEIDRMIAIVTELNLQYGVLVSVYPVSSLDFAGLDSPILINVRREGIRV